MMPCGHDERELRVMGTPGLVLGAPVSDLHWYCILCDLEGRLIAEALLTHVETRRVA